jgi:hypothetical protein
LNRRAEENWLEVIGLVGLSIFGETLEFVPFVALSGARAFSGS